MGGLNRGWLKGGWLKGGGKWAFEYGIKVD